MQRIFTLTNGRRIRIVEGDITQVPVDAIANAANSSLAGGGGVDGAIHRAGGPQIMEELDTVRPEVGRLAPGRAVATNAGSLPAKYVFHAVGPIYRGGTRGEPEALASCYRSCFALAEQRHCRTISFPSISTGIYGYPFDHAAVIAVRQVIAFLNEPRAEVEEVVFVLHGSDAYEIYEALLDNAVPNHLKHGR